MSDLTTTSETGKEIWLVSLYSLPRSEGCKGTRPENHGHPDRPFNKGKASKMLILCDSEMSCDGFRSSKVVKNYLSPVMKTSSVTSLNIIANNYLIVAPFVVPSIQQFVDGQRLLIVLVQRLLKSQLGC